MQQIKQIEWLKVISVLSFFTIFWCISFNLSFFDQSVISIIAFSDFINGKALSSLYDFIIVTGLYISIRSYKIKEIRITSFYTSTLFFMLSSHHFAYNSDLTLSMIKIDNLGPLYLYFIMPLIITELFLTFINKAKKVKNYDQVTIISISALFVLISSSSFYAHANFLLDEEYFIANTCIKTKGKNSFAEPSKIYLQSNGYIIARVKDNYGYQPIPVSTVETIDKSCLKPNRLRPLHNPDQ